MACDAEYNRHQLNPYLYTIEVCHGNFRWLIHKRYHHFWKLHKAIKLDKLKQSLTLQQLALQDENDDNGTLTADEVSHDTL